MTKVVPDNELLANINQSMSSLPAESANEIALILLFTEYAALSHPSSLYSNSKINQIETLKKKFLNVINDLSKYEREKLSPIIKGIQLIKYMSEEK